MIHVPIKPQAEPSSVLEFSHYDRHAPAGLWKKEDVITRDLIKINVFVEGSFSIFTDGALYHPATGDVCVLAPMKMHYGQITTPMHINYSQLDVGTGALSGVPDGSLLLERLADLTARENSFLRPTAEKRAAILGLCEEIEGAIRAQTLSLAFAKVVELLHTLYPLYLNPTSPGGAPFTLRTAQVIRYIEQHYGESVTIKDLAATLGVSASFLSRIFKRESGFTVHEYLNRYRILRSTEWLKTRSVTDTAYACGFSDNSHFIALFKKHMKQTPLQYKKSNNLM